MPDVKKRNIAEEGKNVAYPKVKTGNKSGGGKKGTSSSNSSFKGIGGQASQGTTGSNKRGAW